MTDPEDKPATEIARRAARMKTAREQPGTSPLRGLGTFGMIGWSIVVPTVGGAFLGLWLDRVAPQDFSWTIALILLGVLVGCAMAWTWVNKEGDGK